MVAIKLKLQRSNPNSKADLTFCGHAVVCLVRVCSLVVHSAYIAVCVVHVQYVPSLHAYASRSHYTFVACRTCSRQIASGYYANANVISVDLAGQNEASMYGKNILIEKCLS